MGPVSLRVAHRALRGRRTAFLVRPSRQSCDTRALFAGFFLLVIGAVRADAQGFSVNPIRLELIPSQRATSVTVANYNAKDLFMQVRVYRWEHKGNEDVLTEAGVEAPLVTPPLFRLAPSGSQVIRIGFLGGSTRLTEERQWRVIVEEVAKTGLDPTESSSEPDVPLSVAVHVRVSLPLFQRPSTVRQNMGWTLERSALGSVTLSAQNLGSVTERLDELHLGPSDHPSTSVSGPVYVFPGERRVFDLNPNTLLSPGIVHLTVRGTPQPLIRELVLSAQ